MKAKILGTGMYVPSQVVENSHFEELIQEAKGKDASWIKDVTGISQRRWGEETSSQLATKAAQDALKNANIEVGDIDHIIVATSTPDKEIPSTAAYVQSALGSTCGIVDVDSDCVGFLHALTYGARMIQCEDAQYVLVVGAEQYTRLVDEKEYTSAILFGEGAGAVVLGPGDVGVGRSYFGGGGDVDVITTVDGKFTMKGRNVVDFAVKAMPRSVEEVLKKEGKSIDDLALLIPHQSNARIMKKAREKLGLSEDKVYSNLERYGNTAAASVAIALHEAVSEKKLTEGDLACLVAYGAGPAMGAVLVYF